jgi:hypothetical protein
MTFARSLTHRADISRENFTCTSSSSPKSFGPCQHKRARHSTISLSCQKLSSALCKSIYDEQTTTASFQMSQPTPEALPPQCNPPRDAQPTDRAISGSSRDPPNLVMSSQGDPSSPSLVSMNNGVTILRYPDGHTVIHSIPEKLWSPNNIREIFQDLFEPLPDYPLDSEGGAPSAYQFLESWLATNPDNGCSPTCTLEQKH